METDCDSAHSWQLYGVAPLGNEVIGIMLSYSAQSHYRETEQVTIVLRHQCQGPGYVGDSDKDIVCKSLVYLGKCIYCTLLDIRRKIHNLMILSSYHFLR